MREFILAPGIGLAAAVGGALVFYGMREFNMPPMYAAVIAVCYILGCAASCVVAAVKEK